MLAKIKSKLSGNMLFSVGHQLLTAVYGFGLLIILYRVSSKADIGRWILISSSVSLMDMLMHGFLQTPVIRKLSIEQPGVKWINTIASNALFYALCIWLIVSVLILTSSLLYHTRLLLDLRWYAALGFSMAFYNVSWWIGNARSNFKAVLIQRIIFSVVSVSIILYFVLSKTGLTIPGIILAHFIGYSISALCAFVFINKISLSPKLINRGYLKFFFNYGKFTAGSMMMGSMLRNADIFMIDAFMGQAAVAVYGTAQKTVEIFEVALRGIASHSLPDFCKIARDRKLLLQKYISLTSLIVFAALPLGFFMFIFSDKVIQLLSGSNAFGEASIILKVFMVYVVFLVVDRMTGVTLEAMGLARYNLVKTMLLVIVNISGNAVALYFFRSLPGVAFVSILAAITGMVSGWYFILQNAGLSIKRHHLVTGLNFVMK